MSIAGQANGRQPKPPVLLVKSPEALTSRRFINHVRLLISNVVTWACMVSFSSSLSTPSLWTSSVSQVSPPLDIPHLLVTLYCMHFRTATSSRLSSGIHIVGHSAEGVASPCFLRRVEVPMSAASSRYHLPSLAVLPLPPRPAPGPPACRPVAPQPAARSARLVRDPSSCFRRIVVALAAAL